MYRYLYCRSVNLFLSKALIFCCYVSLDSLLWWPTGRLAGTKREFATNAVFAAGLSGSLTHTVGEMASPET